MALLVGLPRKYPSSNVGFSGDTVSAYSYTDPITNVTQVYETFHAHGIPARSIKLAALIGITNEGSFYPDNGGGGIVGTFPAVPAVNGGITVAFSTTVLQSQNATLPPDAMIFTILDGAAKGQYRNIIGASGTFSSTRMATINRAWATAEGVPAGGDHYAILFDISWATEYTLRAEYSAVGNTNVAQIIPIMYDVGRQGTVTFREPWRTPDVQLSLANMGLTVLGSLETGYSIAKPETRESRGFYGVQVYVVDIPSGLTVSIWAAAT